MCKAENLNEDVVNSKPNPKKKKKKEYDLMLPHTLTIDVCTRIWWSANKKVIKVISTNSNVCNTVS